MVWDHPIVLNEFGFEFEGEICGFHGGIIAWVYGKRNPLTQ